MKFEYPEDKIHFKNMLSLIGDLTTHKHLFDLRSPLEKRQEFNRIRKTIFNELVLKYGDECQLKYHEDCTGKAEQIDHLIPLSSNKLNKELRNVVGKDGKKVPTQSFGSNHETNFVLSCSRCNSAKKHRLPSKELIASIFARRK